VYSGVKSKVAGNMKSINKTNARKSGAIQTNEDAYEV
jgi:hypothetical protein